MGLHCLCGSEELIEETEEWPFPLCEGCYELLGSPNDPPTQEIVELAARLTNQEED